MPSSRKPRKKHNTRRNYARVADSPFALWLVRGRTWDPETVNDFAADFLFPFSAIYYSREGRCAQIERQFHIAKNALVLCWVAAGQLNECERVRDLVGRANALFQTVYGVWDDHNGKVLYPQLKQCWRIAVDLFEDVITTAFQPYEIFQIHRWVGHSSAPCVFDRAEEALDATLGNYLKRFRK